MSKPVEESKEVDQTEHAKLSRLVVSKMHDPQNIHDKQIHTNISKNILSNVLLLATGTDGLKELTRGDLEMIDSENKTVTIFRKTKIRKLNTETKQIEEVEELVPYRTLSRAAYVENQFFGEFWSRMTGNLMEELMSVPVGNGEGGWRGMQAEREVGSLVGGDKAMIEALNAKKPGMLTKMRNALK